MLFSATTSILLLSAQAFASPVELAERQEAQCHDIFMFGVRETNADPGYGVQGVQDILNGISSVWPNPQSMGDWIRYPACDKAGSCAGSSYALSVVEGIDDLVSAVNELHTKCPDTQFILAGAGQGAHVVNNALCGGPDDGIALETTESPISSEALAMVRAAVVMGDPRHTEGEPNNAGTCTGSGTAPRTKDSKCALEIIKASFCDEQDAECCATRASTSSAGSPSAPILYGQRYKADIMTFLQSKIYTKTA